MPQTANQQPDLFDILIIGGGPTGLFAAFSAGLRGMKTMLIDSLPELGGQLAAFYPEKYIYDVPGFPKILAKDYANLLIEQAMPYHPEIILEEKILRLETIDLDGREIFKLVTERGGDLYAKALLITALPGSLAPRRPDLPDIDRFEGRGVSYYVKEKEKMRRKNVLIVGGGDSAFDWTSSLLDIASEITLVHRRNQFRAQEENIRKIRQSTVNIMTPYEVKEISGSDSVEGAVVVNVLTREEQYIAVDQIVFCLGFEASDDPVLHWGLEMNRKDIKITTKMETNRRGIYAAGDACWYPGKVKLIVTGMGEAAVAVNAIKVAIGLL